jgi:dihydroorotate dehydrogenase
MSLYRSVVGPVLGLLGGETAHRLTIQLLKTGLAPKDVLPEDPALAITVWGHRFRNPIGLAAGFDKNAEVATAALRLGFGFVEVGTITPRPQPGNPKPRLFRLAEDRALINRMGFPGDGLEAARERLKTRDRVRIVGVNIGANKDSVDRAADYVTCTQALMPYADYIVCNVSSPNTPGLRDLQARDALTGLLKGVKGVLGARKIPVVVKVAPDLTAADFEDIVAAAVEASIDGMIVGNTTVSRPSGLRSARRSETGGLSGAPLAALSTGVLRIAAKHVAGRFPLVGCGGVASGKDAYAKIRAGASLVQLYSALVYEGPGLVRRIKDELAVLLKADGFTSVAQAIGADL